MISVNIICKDEEKNIEDCLKSVEWADEIIVVDGESSDQTAEIAKKYTEHVYVKAWEGFYKQRKFALEKSTKDWILALDADERCSEELRDNILLTAKSNSIENKGFRLARKNFFLGRWIKHGGWYPGYQMRFFRRDSVSISDRLVHEGYEILGNSGVLKGDILHYTVQSISEFAGRINKYSTLQAAEKSKRINAGFAGMLIQPLKSFIVQYIFKRGFLDGIFGLMAYYFDSITRMLTYMKIWELQNKDKNK